MRGHRLFTAFLLLAGPLALCSAPSSFAQAGSSTSPSQDQSAASGQTASQTPPAADSSSQPQSLADAARANKQNTKPKAKKVYTEENLGDIHGTISVVGDKSSRSADADSAPPGAAPQDKSESYWRSRAQAIKREIAEADKQIADVKAEIAKGGAASFDPSSGLAQGVIIIHDRNAQLKELEDRKAGLQRQLDDLADEARKAGADPGWAR